MKRSTLKQVEPVFPELQFQIRVPLSQNIKITNSSFHSTKDVLIIANFDVTHAKRSNWSYTRTGIMDNTAIIVTKSPVPMSLGAGEFNLW
jgi:hypothetical protein